jgi:hypothetical protein
MSRARVRGRHVHEDQMRGLIQPVPARGGFSLPHRRRATGRAERLGHFFSTFIVFDGQQNEPASDQRQHQEHRASNPANGSPQRPQKRWRPSPPNPLSLSFSDRPLSARFPARIATGCDQLSPRRWTQRADIRSYTRALCRRNVEGGRRRPREILGIDLRVASWSLRHGGITHIAFSHRRHMLGRAECQPAEPKFLRRFAG